MMKENITGFKLLLVASAVVCVGFTIAIILIKHDSATTIKMVVPNIILLAIGAIMLFFPKLSVNYGPHRVNGKWRTTKEHVPPNIFTGVIILITIILNSITAFLD